MEYILWAVYIHVGLSWKKYFWIKKLNGKLICAFIIFNPFKHWTGVNSNKNSNISIYITSMPCGGVTVLWAEPKVSRPLNWLNAHLGCHGRCAYLIYTCIPSRHQTLDQHWINVVLGPWINVMKMVAFENWIDVIFATLDQR